MRRTLNVACIAGIQIVVLVLVALALDITAPAHGGTMRACPNDSDSRNCVWDARHMGNGSGHSYVATRTGKITYISHARAHRLLGL